MNLPRSKDTKEPLRCRHISKLECRMIRSYETVASECFIPSEMNGKWGVVRRLRRVEFAYCVTPT